MLSSKRTYGIAAKAQVHMACCKSIYGGLQEHICCVERTHIALSGPEQASQWANTDNEYTKMNLSARSTILDGSREPVIVPNDGL